MRRESIKAQIARLNWRDKDYQTKRMTLVILDIRTRYKSIRGQLTAAAKVAEMEERLSRAIRVSDPDQRKAQAMLKAFIVGLQEKGGFIG